MAVPPPPARSVVPVAIPPTACRVELKGTAMPYAPAQFRFTARAGTTLQLMLANPDPHLLFDLTDANGKLAIAGTGFGAGDVRIRLPTDGAYTLAVSAFDRAQWRSLKADIVIGARITDPARPVAC